MFEAAPLGGSGTSSENSGAETPKLGLDGDLVGRLVASGYHGTLQTEQVAFGPRASPGIGTTEAGGPLGSIPFAGRVRILADLLGPPSGHRGALPTPGPLQPWADLKRELDFPVRARHQVMGGLKPIRLALNHVNSTTCQRDPSADSFPRPSKGLAAAPP